MARKAPHKRCPYCQHPQKNLAKHIYACARYHGVKLPEKPKKKVAGQKVETPPSKKDKYTSLTLGPAVYFNPQW